jgi:hypothetical protein
MWPRVERGVLGRALGVVDFQFGPKATPQGNSPT